MLKAGFGRDQKKQFENEGESMLSGITNNMYDMINSVWMIAMLLSTICLNVSYYSSSTKGSQNM